MENETKPKETVSVKITAQNEGIWPDLGEVYHQRNLLIMLAQRQIRGRYAQTALGIFWALVQPVSYMVILNLFFGLIGRFGAGDVPYPLFLLSALVPYQFYVKCMGEGAGSVLANEALIGKVFFPRISFPIVTVSTAIVDFLVAFGFFLLLLLIYQIPIGAPVLILPLMVFNLLVLSLGTAIFLSALSVKYRDLRLAIPTISQLLFFASPIWYPSTMIPEKYHLLWGLNPLAGIIEGFRWSFFSETQEPSFILMLGSAITAIVIFVAGLLYFKKVEREMVDML